MFVYQTFTKQYFVLDRGSGWLQLPDSPSIWTRYGVKSIKTFVV